MAKSEDQRILVWCNSTENIQQTIFDAAIFAMKLRKELCFFANYKNKKEESTFKERINSYASTVKQDIPQMEVSTLLLEGKLHPMMKDLGEKYNAIMLCCGGKFNRKLLKAFYHSGFPFYFSRKNSSQNNRLHKILIPIDFRNSTKDSVLWGSYLGRFNQSEITLLCAKDNDGELYQKVAGIKQSTEKLYRQFSFKYRFQSGKAGSWKIHNEAVRNSAKYDLLIFTGSLNATLPDQIIGPFERRMINKCKETPVLVINPQLEMYMVCCTDNRNE
jgi:hypothetical protein